MVALIWTDDTEDYIHNWLIYQLYFQLTYSFFLLTIKKHFNIFLESMF